MHSAIAALGFFLLLGMGSVGAEDNPWLAAPPVVKALSAADRDARDGLLKIIADKQDRVSRDGWNLDVPQQACGLATKYDLVLHRSNGCFSETRARLEIQVRDGRARWELCEFGGIYRVERPAEEIDRLIRRLAYAFHAVERPGKERDLSFSFSIGPPPHYLEVVSRDDKAPFHLQPSSLQIDLHPSGRPVDRVRTYEFAGLAEYVFKTAESECRLIPAEEEASEILRRLKAVPALRENLEVEILEQPAAGETEKLTKTRRYQIDLERELLGDMAVKLALKDALPELQRLSLVEEEKQLRIAVLADPRPQIVQAIVEHKKDPQLAAWAERFAADDRHPERLECLIDALSRLESDPPDSQPAFSILYELARKKLTKDQLTSLAARFAETKNALQKIGAANVLLRNTHEERYFQYLDSLVRSLPPIAEANEREPWRMTAEYVFRYAVDSGKRRIEARSLLKKLLQEPIRKEDPDSFAMFELVEFLGDLGTSEDVAYLAGLAETGSPYLMSSATKALGKLDPERALVVLHARMKRWIERPADSLAYSHEIYSNFELILFERDTAAAPLLKRAWEKLKSGSRTQDGPFKSEDELTSSGYNPEHVIAFLEAKTGPARVEAAIAHFGDRAHLHDRTRMQRLVTQLIAEGAAPERCNLLLIDPDESPRGR